MDDLQAPAPAEQSPIAESPEPVEQATPDTPDATPEPKEAVKTPSRRDALEKALKATSGDDDETAKPAEKADTGPERGPDGKFAAKADKADAKPEADTEAAKTAERSPISEAPSRFSPDAKAAWKDAPKAIQGEIHRAISEMERGIAEKDQQLAPLKPFMELAKKSGTTVHDALGNYVRMEQLLRQDPVRGLAAIAQNMGMTLPALIGKVTGQQPAQAQEAKDREILGLRQQIQQMQQQLGGVQQTFRQQQEQAVLSQVEQFAAAHPRFDELSDEIARLLQTGYAADLKEAYEKAERLNPLPQEVSPQPAVAAQPREQKSITGAPTAGSNPAIRRPSGSRMEALQRAMNRAGLA